MMGLTLRSALKLITRESNHTPGPMPDSFVDSVYEHFDHGTQRAILKLYRASPEALLESAGDDLGDLRCPALVLWAMDDPYVGPEHSRDLADRLGGTVTVEELEGAGHWPWIADRPELVERAADFLVS